MRKSICRLIESVLAMAIALVCLYGGINLFVGLMNNPDATFVMVDGVKEVAATSQMFVAFALMGFGATAFIAICLMIVAFAPRKTVEAK